MSCPGIHTKTFSCRCRGHLMPVLILLFFFLIISPRYLYAQEGGGRMDNLNDAYAASKIYFCESVSPDGEPVRPGRTFTVPGKGGFVYVLLRNNGLPIGASALTVDIYKDDNLMETKMVKSDPSSYFVSFSYTFYSTAQYSFHFYDERHTWINTADVSVRNQDDTRLGEDYSSATLLLCDQVFGNGTPWKIYDSVTLEDDKKSVLLLVQDQKDGLQTAAVKTEVEKDGRITEENEYPVNAYSTFAYFPYTFTRMGNYTFRVYNEKNVLIGSCTINITR